MREILLRSGKDPFTPVSGEATRAQDVFNTNVGNYLFAHSVHRTLMVPGLELTSNGTVSETREATKRDVRRVNERFESFVIPLANAFRPEFAARLSHLTTLVSQLEIPVVVVGVGAQAGPDLAAMPVSDLDEVVRDFVAAVLERSQSIGVRGEFTADYLRRLGFPADTVDVIGCPSLYLNGPDFLLPDAGRPIDSRSRIALNVTNGVPGLGGFVTRLMEEHPEVVYVGQDRADIDTLMWGDPPPEGTDLDLPLHLGHQLYRDDRVRFPLETWTWLTLMRDFDLAVGTRLHGNIAALLAGTPAVLLAHDSRTSELARLHHLPHRDAADLLPQPPSARDLHEGYDPSPFNANYPVLFRSYLDFLERNGLEHIHQLGRTSTEFDDRVAAADFPAPLAPLGAHPEELSSRLRWLRDGVAFDSKRHTQAYRAPYPHPPARDQLTGAKGAEREVAGRVDQVEKELRSTRRKLEKSRAALSAQRQKIDGQAARLTRQATRLDALEERLSQTTYTRLKRRLRRLFG